jgi:hypothetical protein
MQNGHEKWVQKMGSKNHHEKWSRKMDSKNRSKNDHKK